MTEIPTLYKGVIPDEYKYNISKSRIKFTNAELPTLPTLNMGPNKVMLQVLSESYPYYVCEDIVEFYNDETTMPSITINNILGRYTFTVNVNLDTDCEKYFRFVRLILSIGSSIRVQNNYFNGNATIILKVNVKCGSNSQCSASTVIKTLSPGQSTVLRDGYYYYDFIYDTRLNSLMFEKKVF
jgi:hypothetical protein